MIMLTSSLYTQLFFVLAKFAPLLASAPVPLSPYTRPDRTRACTPTHARTAARKECELKRGLTKGCPIFTAHVLHGIYVMSCTSPRLLASSSSVAWRGSLRTRSARQAYCTSTTEVGNARTASSASSALAWLSVGSPSLVEHESLMDSIQIGSGAGGCVCLRAWTSRGSVHDAAYGRSGDGGVLKSANASRGTHGAMETSRSVSAARSCGGSDGSTTRATRSRATECSGAGGATWHSRSPAKTPALVNPSAAVVSGS
mmetsp:Transcript_24297/g.79248  ORF Transcript_24297/g.79248 Transcript_24297/m.79248 type:complete len:257 (-) Transcript_24297:4038-4808(-)